MECETKSFSDNLMATGFTTKKKKKKSKHERVDNHNSEYKQWIERHSPKKKPEKFQFSEPNSPKKKNTLGEEQVYTNASKLVDNEIFHYASWKSSKPGKTRDFFVGEVTSKSPEKKQKQRKMKKIEENGFDLEEFDQMFHKPNSEVENLEQILNSSNKDYFVKKDKKHKKKQKDISEAFYDFQKETEEIENFKCDNVYNKKKKQERIVGEVENLDFFSLTSKEYSDSNVKRQKKKKKKREPPEAKLTSDNTTTSYDNKDTTLRDLNEIDIELNGKHKIKKKRRHKSFEELLIHDNPDEDLSEKKENSNTKDKKSNKKDKDAINDTLENDSDIKSSKKKKKKNKLFEDLVNDNKISNYDNIDLSEIDSESNEKHKIKKKKRKHKFLEEQLIHNILDEDPSKNTRDGKRKKKENIEKDKVSSTSEAVCDALENDSEVKSQKKKKKKNKLPEEDLMNNITDYDNKYPTLRDYEIYSESNGKCKKKKKKHKSFEEHDDIANEEDNDTIDEKRKKKEKTEKDRVTSISEAVKDPLESNSDISNQKKKKKKNEQAEEDVMNYNEITNFDKGDTTPKDLSEIDSEANEKHKIKKKKNKDRYFEEQNTHGVTNEGSPEQEEISYTKHEILKKKEKTIENDKESSIDTLERDSSTKKKHKKQKNFERNQNGDIEALNGLSDIAIKISEMETDTEENNLTQNEFTFIENRRKKKEEKLENRGEKEMSPGTVSDYLDFLSSTRKDCSDPDNNRKEAVLDNEKTAEINVVLADLSEIVDESNARHKRKYENKDVEKSPEEKMNKKRQHSSLSSIEDEYFHKKKKKRSLDYESNLSTDYSMFCQTVLHESDSQIDLKDSGSQKFKQGNTSLHDVDVKSEKGSSSDNAKTDSRASQDSFTIEVHEDIENKKKINPKKKPFLRGKYHINAVKKSFQNLESSEDVEIGQYDKTFAEMLDDVEPEDLSLAVVERLSQLEVVLPWAVPALHLIETGIVALPTAEQRARMEELNVPIKKGIFTKAEDELIKRNWKLFCKKNDLPDDPRPFLNFKPQRDAKCIIPVNTRLQFGRFLAHGLESRTLVSVYKRFQRLFTQSKLKSGRFSKEEDTIIREFIKTTSSSNPYADLGKILNRQKLSVERRCRKLVQQNTEETNVRWSKARIKKLVNILLEIVGSENVKDLKNRDFTEQEWAEISKSMNLSTVKVRSSWLNTIHPRLFVKTFKNRAEVKMKLVETLIQRGEDDWRNVNWKDIATEFDGFTGSALNKMLKGMTNYHVANLYHHDLKVCLEILAKVDFVSFRIKKIALKDVKD